MGRIQLPARRVVAAAAVVLAVGFGGAVRAADGDDALRAKALKLNEITGEDPIKGQILSLLDDKEGTKKLLAVAKKLAQQKDQPFNINATYILGRTCRALKDMEGAEQFYRLHADQAKKLQSAYKLAQAFNGLIDLYYENQKFAESEKLCKEFLELPDDEGAVSQAKSVVLRRMIMALAKQGKGAQALKLVDNMVKRQPDNWLALELRGWVQRETGEFEDAAKTYEDVLARIGKDKRLSNEERKEFGNQVRYILSGVYIDFDQVEKAADHLKSLLGDEPDNPTYNNDLGYIWADHDMNLDDAEKMIRKALDQDRKRRHKENPDLKPDEDKDVAAYLDSLGWVLFKRKKFKEAKEALLQAVKDPEGQHIEILDHLADVHMALGERAEAIAAWKKGLEVAGPSKREQQRKVVVEKKLKTEQEKQAQK